jgi:hypothetical protein
MLMVYTCSHLCAAHLAVVSLISDYKQHLALDPQISEWRCYTKSQRCGLLCQDSV